MKLSNLSLAVVLAVLASAPALAQDRMNMRQGMDHGAMKPMAGQSQVITGSGVVKGVDTVKRRLNLSHETIPALGWSAMTMEFDVVKTVDLGRIKAGQAVEFGLAKNADGGYVITAVKPKG